MKKPGYRTFAEVLRRVPGSADRNYGYIATRGFMSPGSYNDRMLIQTDGHRLHEKPTTGPMSTRSFLWTHLIDAVNEIRCSRGKKFSLDKSVNRAYHFALGLD